MGNIYTPEYIYLELYIYIFKSCVSKLNFRFFSPGEGLGEGTVTAFHLTMARFIYTVNLPLWYLEEVFIC